MQSLRRSKLQNATDIAKLVIGIVLFGELMGTREEFGSRWTRDLVAGLAFAILARCHTAGGRAERFFRR